MSDTKISIGTTIGDAFGFASSRFGTIIKVFWFPAVAGFAGMGALIFLMLRPLIGPYVSLMGAAMNPVNMDASADANTALLDAMTDVGFGQLALAYMLIMFVGQFIYAIPTVAYSRMMVDDYSPRGPVYFKLGSKEVFVALDYITIWIIGLVLATVIAAIAMFALGGFAALTGPAGKADPTAIGGAIGTILLALFGVMFVFCWIFAKFGLAFPIASLEGGLGLRRAWAMSRGHTFTLTMSIFLAYVLMTVLLVIAMIVLGIVSVPISMVGALMGDGVLPMVLIGILYGLFYIVTYAVMLAVLVSLFSGVYKRIKGSSAAAAEIA